MQKNAKILILGSQGNLGSYIVEEFNKKVEWKVFPWTRKDCDVSDMADLEKKIIELNPDVVINTVAYNAVDACEDSLEEQAKAITLNVRLVDCLAKVCNMTDTKLIQFSTNYVFAGEKETYSEEDEPCPVNFYGLSKLMSEKVVNEQRKVGLKACILRVSNLYGPKGTGTSSKASFFDFLSNVAQTQEFLQVINDEKNCFTYTKDVAVRLVEMLDEDDFEGTYHFVNSTASTWYEAALYYYKLQNKAVDMRPIDGSEFNRKAKRPKTAVLVSTRMKPMRSFEDAITDYVKEYLNSEI